MCSLKSSMALASSDCAAEDSPRSASGREGVREEMTLVLEAAEPRYCHTMKAEYSFRSSVSR
jgi:hypothetical protein